MKREIPRRIPGILPFVRHRNDIGIIEMRPVRVAAVKAFTRRFRHTRVAFEPPIDIVVIKLFTPEHSRKGLPLHTARIFGQMARRKTVVELVRFLEACRKDRVEVLVGETQAL